MSVSVAHGLRAATDESLARSHAINGDLRFKRAMLRARRAKREHFVLGVDERPGTTCNFSPTPITQVFAYNASPAAQCADFGGL